MKIYAFAFFSAFFGVTLITPVIRRIAFRLKVLDFPSSRKVHTTLIPRFGGVAIYVGMLFTLTATYAMLPETRNPILEAIHQGALLIAGATLLCAIGMIDDMRSIRAQHKLLFQVLSALLAYWGGFQLRFFDHAGSVFLLGNVANLLMTIAWITVVTNAINLIDGLDGLATGITTIAAIILALISYANGQTITLFLALAITGCALGFLLYNIHPAKIFLGDSGSLFLGFLLATLSIQGTRHGSPLIPMVIALLLLMVPLLDTVLAFTRRYVKGYPIFLSDGNHIHHRLLQRGVSHSKSVMILWAATLSFGFMALWLSFARTRYEVGLILVLSVVLIGLALRRFGFVEIHCLLNVMLHWNGRKLSPRKKNQRVRSAVNDMAGVKDLNALNLCFSDLADEIGLDSFSIEVAFSPAEKRRLKLVQWNRIREASSIPPDGSEREICETRVFFNEHSGIWGFVALGKERWKARRKSEEDRVWASMIADEIVSLKETMLKWSNAGLSHDPQGHWFRAPGSPVAEGEQAVEKVSLYALGCHSRESGNPEVIDFKLTGFPIKYSGMTDSEFFNTLLM